MKLKLLMFLVLAGYCINLAAAKKSGNSCYTLKPADLEAVYFTHHGFINHCDNQMGSGFAGIYDLGRSMELMVVTPGQSQPVYVSHEDPKITYQFDLAVDGKLTNMRKAFARGEYGSVVDTDGTLYLAEGQIFVFDKDGKEKKRINLDERPISLAIGGKDKNELFVTTSTSFYKIKIK